MNDLELTHSAVRLAFWWLVGVLLLVRAWYPSGHRSLLGQLAILGAAVYVLALHAPSLGQEKISLKQHQLTIVTGRWNRPHPIRHGLADVMVVLEVANPHWTVADRYLILQDADFKRRRLRQNALLKSHREAVFKAMEARGIKVLRAP